MIAIYVDIFKNITTTYIIPDKKNEKIENNNTYYLFINTTISSSCGKGQYYDPLKYSLCLTKLKIKFFEKNNMQTMPF